MKSYTGSTLTQTMYYFGNYEEKQNVKLYRYHYIYSPDGLVAIMRQQSTTKSMYWVAHDNLGSILALFDQNRTKVQENSFDAWGRRRNPTNWSYNSVPATTVITRGYTGHEHMDDFKLINMNGRVYDPVLGRFLSADPVVQDATNSQFFNRYSYCVGNPLKYVDPSGYVISQGTFEATVYLHTQSWQRYLNECGITGMDDFAYGMGVEAGMDALIHSITPKGLGVNEDDGPPDADKLEDRTLGGSGDGDEDIEPHQSTKDQTLYNNYSKTIYFKPESDYIDNEGNFYSNSGAYPLEPYNYTTVPIDGFVIDGTVYKITNGYSEISINTKGDVSITWSYAVFSWVYSHKGGIITTAPDQSRYELFNH